ncbi:hypothetical protein ACHAWO_002759 [Cyclotella atomus]|uniref:Helicase-associated domain-containing protein n=1 Tax=Cyclotella atomus TaxID=382360 RepID=A0ABD3QL89_9STRA
MDAFIEALEAPIGDFETVNVDTPNKQTHKEKLEEQWMATYQQLIQFNAEKSKTHKALGEWVHGQRRAYKQNKLSKERVDLLDAIGFVWYPMTNDWEKMYEKLVQFKAEQGHCNVPYKSKQLAKWVERQRKRHQTDAITPEQSKQLTEIGFLFEPNAVKWDAMYEKLKEFRKKVGHADVPNKYQDDPALGRWCIKQRSDYKNNAIKIERYELLVDIGFEFRDEGGPDVTIGGKKKVLTKEDRQIELLKKCREALAKTGEENKRLTADNKRKAEQIREQADTIKRLKATIRALASD